MQETILLWYEVAVRSLFRGRAQCSAHLLLLLPRAFGEVVDGKSVRRRLQLRLLLDDLLQEADVHRHRLDWQGVAHQLVLAVLLLQLSHPDHLCLRRLTLALATDNP